MPKMEFLPCPTIERLSEQSETSLQVSEVSLPTHVGTHVDAACHAVADGASIEGYPIDRFVSTAAIVEVDAEPKGPISVSDIEPSVDLIGTDPDAVIVRTGWEEKIGHSDYYDHPYFSVELAEWFVDWDLSWVGMDFLTPDKPPELRKEGFTYPVHTTLLGEDVLIVENLTNVGALDADLVEVTALPVKFRGADAAPMRVAARPAE
jgi:kynurenine formamidase